MCTRSIIKTILLASLILCSESHAEYNLRLLSSSPANAYQHTADALTQALHSSTPDVSFDRQTLVNGLSTASVQPTFAIEHPDWQVAIGSRACDTLLHATTESPTLCAFITATAFKQLRQKHSDRKQVHGLSIDQPMPRLTRLAALLNPEKSQHRIGLLATDNPSNQTTVQLTSDIELHTTRLDVDDNPIKRLQPLISNNDSVIVLPGSSHLNQLAAKLVLQLSLKHKTPIIGFSKKYTDAGALLSIHPSPQDIAKDIADLLQSNPDSASLPQLQPGKSFSLSTNKNVARKLRYQLDTEILKHHLQSSNSGL